MADIHNLKHVLNRDAKGYIAKLKPDDRDDVQRFIEDLQANGISSGRIIKYLTSFVSINKHLDKPFNKAESKDLKKYVAWLESSEYSDWTKHDLKIILKKYLQWLEKEDTITWLKIKPVKSGKLPEEILTEDDIKAMAGVSYTSRDEAYVLSFHESGCRIGEFLPLQLKHVAFDNHGALLRVTGKTGDRRIRIVASVQSLQKWINEHPNKNDPEAYLWCKIPTSNNPKFKNNHLSYGFLTRLLKELKKKAGVKKSVNPHAFRHSRATFMAKHLKEPQMREFFGWGNDSDMPSIYVHLSGRDMDDSVLSIYNIKEAEKSSEPIIKTWECIRCKEVNSPVSTYCAKCGLSNDVQAFNIEKLDIDKMDKIEGLLVDFLKIIGDEIPQVKEKLREVVKNRGDNGLF